MKLKLHESGTSYNADWSLVKNEAIHSRRRSYDGVKRLEIRSAVRVGKYPARHHALARDRK
jgi:hypothetical protein